MTKKEKRIAVAKDALLQLKREVYLATRGVYFDGPLRQNMNLIDDDQQQAKPFLLKSEAKCAVCARGAILLSTIRKYNNCTIGALDLFDESVSYELFGDEALELMESAFELSTIFVTDSSEEKAYKAVEFGRKHETSHDRLVAILKNIVKNGNFKP